MEQQLDAAGPDTWLVHPLLAASLRELLAVGSNGGARLVGHHALAPGLGILVEPQAVGLAAAAHIHAAHQGGQAGGRQDDWEGGHCGGYRDDRQEVDHECSLAVEVQQDRMQALDHLSTALLQLVVPGARLGLVLVPGRDEHCVVEGVAMEPHVERCQMVEHCVERRALVGRCGVLEHHVYVATRYEQVVLPEQQYRAVECCVEPPVWVARHGALEHHARVAARSEQVTHLEQDHYGLAGRHVAHAVVVADHLANRQASCSPHILAAALMPLLTLAPMLALVLALAPVLAPVLAMVPAPVSAPVRMRELVLAPADALRPRWWEATTGTHADLVFGFVDDGGFDFDSGIAFFLFLAVDFGYGSPCDEVWNALVLALSQVEQMGSESASWVRPCSARAALA